MLLSEYMIKTTLLLSPMLHQRLLMAAKPTNKPLSDLISDLLDKALAAQEQVRMKRVYEALDKLDGIGPKGITDFIGDYQLSGSGNSNGT